MLAAEEAVPFHFPGLGIHHDVNALSLNDIQEILSALESNDQPASPSSGSERFNQSVYSVDERKKRRMISNRESARRSRWRKKQHLEDLTKEAARLSIANRDLKNRLACVMNQLQALMHENERLISEYGALWAKLSDMYAAMQFNHINREN